MATVTAAAAAAAALMMESTINHVVLPPRLPPRAERNLEAIEMSIVDRLIQGVRQMVAQQPEKKTLDAWEAVRRALQAYKQFNAGGKLNQARLSSALRELQHNDLIIVYILEQNAALTIRRDKQKHEDLVILEAFEASALSKDVLAAGPAIQWDFPGCSVSMDFLNFDEPSFQNEFVTFLDKASTESIKTFAPRAFKSDTTIFESRDTVDPTMITQILMTLLETLGKRIYPTLLRKRVRDEVNWSDGGLKPWRRSPVYLILRVSIQRYMATILGNEAGRSQFKFLMCLVLAQLLQDTRPSIPEEKVNLVHFLKSKMCRRVAKLKLDMEDASQDCKALYTALFQKLEPMFMASEKNASRYIDSVWAKVMKAPRLGCRQVLNLPYYADERDLQMSLLNSGRHLKRAMDASYAQSARESGAFPVSFDLSSLDNKPSSKFVKHSFAISKIEDTLHAQISSPLENVSETCVQLSTMIGDYIRSVGTSYNSNAEQKSIMILNFMDIWIKMDQNAIVAFPLLRDYGPWFTTDLFDVLQLWRVDDMNRLHTIRTYISERAEYVRKNIGDSRAANLTIFSDPEPLCFAARYYDESSDAPRLRALRLKIEQKAEIDRRAKEQEWEEKTKEYEELSQEITESSCLFEPGEYGDVHSRDCPKCWLGWKMKRIKIEGIEHPLPTSEVQIKAVVFELSCPAAFAKYREATWTIAKLAFSNLIGDSEHKWLLCDYTGLKGYGMPTNFSLGSKKKSWLTTHYSKDIRFPVSFEDIHHFNGMMFVYLDLSGTLPNRPIEQKNRPSLAHLFDLQIPKNSPFWPLRALSELAADSGGFSSYQIIANQGLCPSTLNVHEYMAFQVLASGKARRWPQLLVELGSNNLNFSTEAIAVLVRRLSFQAGPFSPNNPLGIVHDVFGDYAFCHMLLNQIEQRLEGMSTNWREAVAMETLITLTLRVFFLGTGVREEALAVIYKIRGITHLWVTLLRMEFVNATDAEAVRRSSNYGLWAGILCRRTFEIYCDSKTTILRDIDVHTYLEATMVIQDNLIRDIATLDTFLKNALIRDFKMVYLIRHIIRQSVVRNPQGVVDALISAWPFIGAGDPNRPFSRVDFLTEGYRWWICVQFPPTMYQSSAVIHVHLLEGHMLYMGSPLGRLPPAWTASGILEELFPGQNLMTYPSQMHGMTHALAMEISEHSFHVGFRDNELILKALFRNTILEFIPRSKFENIYFSDLPSTIIDDNTHWLDLSVGVLEIRPSLHKWKRNEGNWFLNVFSGRLTRRKATLVDTRCGLFTRICNLFAEFEEPRNLLVYQPARGPLVVELRRLELSFFVNPRHLLESRQLRAEFDRDQDAGTFYGLVSKIVLKSVIPHSPQSVPQVNRSIIVPMGALDFKRMGPHTGVHVGNNGAYARYFINDILGRLECAVEPRIIYLKAMFHAYTSSFCPDPLTRRSGIEEAIHTLSSSYSQPWLPLTVSQNLALPLIAALTPHRAYYPKHLKVMQIISWNEDLPTVVQDGRFRAMVDSIQQKSKDISLFAKNQSEIPELDAAGDPHLTQRGQYRFHAIGERIAISNRENIEDVLYTSRDKILMPESRTRVLESITLLQKWPAQLQAIPNIVALLHALPQSSTIAGFNTPLEMALLTDMLDVDFVSALGPLVTFCQGLQKEDRYKAMFWFAVVAFAHGSYLDSTVLKILLAFTMIQDLKQPSALTWPSYEGFQRQQLPTLQVLSDIIRPFFLQYTRDLRDVTTDDTEFALSSKLYRQLRALQKLYEQKQENNASALCGHLLLQWPCSEPSTEGFSPPTTPLLIDLANAMIPIRQEWLRLFKNWELFTYLSTIQQTLTKCTTTNMVATRNEPIKPVEQDVFPSTSSRRDFVGLYTLLRRVSTHKDELNTVSHEPPKVKVSANQPRLYGHSYEAQQLSKIVDELTSTSSSVVRQQYGSDLRESLEALKRSVDQSSSLSKRIFNPTQHRAEMTQAQKSIFLCLSKITQSLEKRTIGVFWRRQGNLWPTISPVTILENLRSNKVQYLNSSMKLDLVNYGLSITRFQRLCRIDDAFQKHNTPKQNEEISNEGHENWRPDEYTDWLLLEIDSNLLLRPTQIDVAHATISPSSGSNSVLQMNMGQGKTSCIMPMAAAALANGKVLMRVIVPKALLLQTAQLLQSRLGGLIGREVKHIPYSRQTPTSLTSTKKYWELHNNTRKQAGVILALPEHILSFKLSGLQQLSDDRIPEAKAMINAQDWLTKSSRDVIDEADSILAIRTQLIYPSGAQKTVDGGSHRWSVIEMLLHQVQSHLWNLQNAYSHSIEVIWRSPGAFPVVSFMRQDVQDDLLQRLVDDIHKGRTAILPQDIPRAGRDLIKKFISEPKISPEEEQTIRDMFPDKPAAKQAVFLLRGLIVHRILLMVLKKRWNVQYGLPPPNRDQIAVPYIAKGTPSEQAEWGHPDVAILFTCLSFYYQGLDIDHFRQTLEHVSKSDDPAETFGRMNFNLPDYLSRWNSINIEDKAQIATIWSYTRTDMTVVDYFLNNYVFVRHAKQFRQKLQASGWDIPLFIAQSTTTQIKSSTSTTTGFSGTNDWKRMLPLTISQADLPSLAHTNALVLTYLLQSRNKRCVRAANERGGHLTEQGLLKLIHAEKIRVLIDAGAAILEMTNLDLVKAWLEIDTEALAAVYFNEDNKPMVYYRSGVKLPLIASTFADDLSGCIVYISQAHCRGVDFKLETYACGALTLGLGATKDEIAQAAMRLRQLGTTQSVRFFVPPGVFQSIIDLRGLPSNAVIDSADVIYWLLVETCSSIEQLQPLYFSQGADFCSRIQAKLDNPDFLSDEQQRETLLKSLRQIELQTLEKMYGISKAKTKVPKSTTVVTPELKDFMRELKLNKKSFQDTGNAVHGSALQEVEQEREVAHEVETVREVERPITYKPFGWHGLHRDVELFVRTGRLTADSAGYDLAFAALGRTTIGRKFRINGSATSGRLFVSKQFTRTVNLPGGVSYDNLQRNVNWVLFSISSCTAMIVIPEEAEEILKILDKTSSTHLICYSSPVTRKMRAFNELAYFAIPTLPSNFSAPMWLKIELGLIASRLYFDYDEYLPILDFLGIENDTTPVEEELEDLTLAANLEPETEDTEITLKASIIPKFARNPQTFLSEYLAVSRKGQEFTQTPMGFISQGKPLLQTHPFFLKDSNSGEGNVTKHTVGQRIVEAQDDDAGDGFLDEEHHFEEGFEQLKDNFDYSELANEKRLLNEENGADEVALEEARLGEATRKAASEESASKEQASRKALSKTATSKMTPVNQASSSEEDDDDESDSEEVGTGSEDSDSDSDY